MTSHSPAIVKRVDPENLRYFRMDKDLLASKVRSITLPEKENAQDQYKYIKEAVRAYPELYFAKLVILGEGDSEEIILPKYWEVLNGSVDVGGISIVPLYAICQGLDKPQNFFNTANTHVSNVDKFICWIIHHRSNSVNISTPQTILGANR